MGPLLCLISAACFGAMAIFGKYAYVAGVTAPTLLLIRFTLAALILAVLVAAGPWARPRGRHLVVALGLGAVGYATQATLFFEALTVMDASLLALILYTYPLMVTAIAALLGRDLLTPARVAALLAASTGTLLVLLGGGVGMLNPLGVTLALGSALTYTLYILVSDRVVQQVPPVPLTATVMAGASAALVVRSAATGGPDVNFAPSGWLWLAAIAVMSTVLAALTFFAGLRRTGPSTAAILSTAEPVVTAALAASLLGESLSPLQWAGGAIVLISVVTVQSKSPAPPTRRTAQSSPRLQPTWRPPDDAVNLLR
ncbi:EamA family transporter [Actinoplanes sp. G11-F43]|uniref:EamA family transporter n=1 Tax=Actinoplanes sp. G11-F43 TaxID=3424130 RepID=UPI003D33F827